jgi:hypothetical protein
MLSNALFDQIYGEMIAGRLPNHAGDVQRTIYFVARDLAHADNLHLLIHQHADFVYYLAAPSKAFASAVEFRTPLAAAFPGHPQHRGDGLYCLTQGLTTVAIETRGDMFRLMANKADDMQAWMADQELPIHEVDGIEPVLMESMPGRYRRLADNFSRKTIKAATWVAGASLGVAMLAMVVDTAFSASLKNTSEQSAQELNRLVSTIEHASPLSMQLAAVQRVSSTVVRAGGWINSYEMVNDKEKFAVSLPEWVTADFITALGPGTTADKDPVNNIIKVEKK